MNFSKSLPPTESKDKRSSHSSHRRSQSHHRAAHGEAGAGEGSGHHGKPPLQRRSQLESKIQQFLQAATPLVTQAGPAAPRSCTFAQKMRLWTQPMDGVDSSAGDWQFPADRRDWYRRFWMDARSVDHPDLTNCSRWQEFLEGERDGSGVVLAVDPNASLLADRVPRLPRIDAKNDYMVLRQAQNKAWAHDSVATGVDFFTVKNDAERAMKAYRHALEIDAECVEALCAIGALYANTGKSQQALAELEKALAIEPTHKNSFEYYERVLNASSDGYARKQSAAYQKIIQRRSAIAQAERMERERLRALQLQQEYAQRSAHEQQSREQPHSRKREESSSPLEEGEERFMYERQRTHRQHYFDRFQEDRRRSQSNSSSPRAPIRKRSRSRSHSRPRSRQRRLPDRSLSRERRRFSREDMHRRPRDPPPVAPADRRPGRWNPPPPPPPREGLPVEDVDRRPPRKRTPEPPYRSQPPEPVASIRTGSVIVAVNGTSANNGRPSPPLSNYPTARRAPAPNLPPPTRRKSYMDDDAVLAAAMREDPSMAARRDSIARDSFRYRNAPPPNPMHSHSRPVDRYVPNEGIDEGEVPPPIRSAEKQRYARDYEGDRYGASANERRYSHSRPHPRDPQRGGWK